MTQTERDRRARMLADPPAALRVKWSPPTDHQARKCKRWGRTYPTAPLP